MASNLVATRETVTKAIYVFRNHDGKALVVRVGINPKAWVSTRRTPEEYIAWQESKRKPLFTPYTG